MRKFEIIFTWTVLLIRLDTVTMLIVIAFDFLFYYFVRFTWMQFNIHIYMLPRMQTVSRKILYEKICWNIHWFFCTYNKRGALLNIRTYTEDDFFSLFFYSVFLSLVHRRHFTSSSRQQNNRRRNIKGTFCCCCFPSLSWLLSNLRISKGNRK